MDDARLVEACQQGDVRAFAALVDRYRYPVFGLCLSYTRDFDAAQDAAQETFIAAYLHLGDLPDPGRFAPWLRRIAANKSRMWLRRQRRRVALPGEEEQRWRDPAPTPEERLLAGEERRRVLAAIARLSRPQQQAVCLFYLRELSLQQVAAFLDLSVQSVEQRLYRARLRLKEELMDMVEKNLKKEHLSGDFAQDVVNEALARGQALLQQRAWSAARREFGRLAEALPDHLDVHRGLALSLNGQVHETLREPRHFVDSDLLEQALQAMHRACQLGADDEELVRTIARLYAWYGRHQEGGRFLEEAAGRRKDWKESAPLLKSAISQYYHAHYTKRGEYVEDCVRCHRRLRALVPADWPARRRLDIWRPAGLSLAYAHQGLSKEVFDELENLRAEVEGEWAVEDFFQYICAITNQYREVGDWNQVEAQSQPYINWARSLPDGDERLDIRPLTLTGHQDDRASLHAGEWFRWWSVCFCLADRVALSRHRAGKEVGGIFAELDQALEAHEAHVRNLQHRAPESAQDKGASKEAEEEKHLSGSYAAAGQAACTTGRYEDALRYYHREEELAGRLAGRGDLYLAASLAALGQVDASRKRLSTIYGRVVTSGQCRFYFDQLREFDALRQDRGIVSLVAEWKRAEQADTNFSTSP